MNQFYRSIHKLPLNLFIDILIDGNYKELIISGEVSDEDLITIWADIISQYGDSFGEVDTEYRVYLSAVKELMHYETKIIKIIQLADTLKDVYTDKLAAHLIKMVRGAGGVKLKFNVNDPEDYENDLERCYAIARGFSINKAIAEETVKSMEARLKSKSNHKATRADFNRSLINLSDHAGFLIRDADITVFEYCERINRYNSYLEQLSKR